MHCFYHQDKEAVGSCKSCGKGVCADCAVDLGKGLACRGRCDEHARAIIELVDRNVRLSTDPAQAQLVVPPISQYTSQPSDYIAAQLTTHIRESVRLRWVLGVFSAVVGVALFMSGLSRENVVWDFIGACCMAFAVVCFVQARRSAMRPRLSETQTR